MNTFIKLVLIQLLLIIFQFFYVDTFAETTGKDDLIKAKCELGRVLNESGEACKYIKNKEEKGQIHHGVPGI